MYPLVAIVGPTASGKSALAVAAAKRLGGEIVNCDSMQIFRGMEIGTAKPSSEERAVVPHHLFDLLEPDEFFSAGRYMEESRRICREISERGSVPFVVGGTGLYLRALVHGLFEGPPANRKIREELSRRAADQGTESLWYLLRELDPESAAEIQRRDEVRLVRALEVFQTTGRPFSELKKRVVPLTGYRVLKVGLDLPRQDLYGRINRRVSRMFSEGLLDEVASLLKTGYGRECKGFEALGYRYAVDTLRGEMDEDEAIRLTRRDSRRYAKRQMTWFRKEKGIHWIRLPGEDPEALKEFRDYYEDWRVRELEG